MNEKVESEAEGPLGEDPGSLEVVLALLKQIDQEQLAAQLPVGDVRATVEFGAATAEELIADVEFITGHELGLDAAIEAASVIDRGDAGASEIAGLSSDNSAMLPIKVLFGDET